MENKEEFTRNNIYSEMLKRVIIRCDFFELIEMDKFIEDQKEFLSEYFDQRRPIEQDQCDILLQSISGNPNETPLSRRIKKIIFHFEKFKPQQINATLDISSDFFCLNILCENNYKGSGIFTNFMCLLIEKLRQSNPFACFTRIGIRKIDIQVMPNKRASIDNYFDKTFWAGRSWNSSPEKICSTLTDILKIGDVNFYVIQRMDKMSKEDKRRLIYDVDAYIEKDYIANHLERKTLKECLEHEMQDEMFNLFRGVASLKYLKKCKEAKERQPY